MLLWIGLGVFLALLLFGGIFFFTQASSCDEVLIKQYVASAQTLIERGDWNDAARDLDSALTECNQCRKENESCALAEKLKPDINCLAQTEKLVSEAQTLLNAGESCAAVELLEQVVGLDCDTKIAEALLAGGKNGGAYLQCAQARLAEPNEENCTQAYSYLDKAHQLKPTNLDIATLYDQADSFATLQQAYNEKNWTDAQQALENAMLLIPSGEYCGNSLKSYQFDILFGQGEELKNTDPCEAESYYKKAGAVTETMAQKADVKQAVASVHKACAASWTPTPTPTATPVPTPTPTPTPQPVAKVTKKVATVRKGPHIRHAKVKTVKQGETLDVVCSTKQADGVWYHVKLPKGDGWIRGDMLSVENSNFTAKCTNVPSPPAIRYCWRSRIAGIDQLEVGRSELYVTAKDAANRPKAGVLIQIINPYGGVTLGNHYTDGNGATAWAAVTPINWKVCVFPERACIIAPYEEQDKSTGIRIRIEFKLSVCN
jgi:tetratricopeptide (TPR) repeat protein